MTSHRRTWELIFLFLCVACLVLVDNITINLMFFVIAHAIAPFVLVYSIFMVYSRVYERILTGALVAMLLAIQVYLIHKKDWIIEDRDDSAVVLVMAILLEFYILRKKNKRYMFQPIDKHCLSFEDLHELNQPLRPISVGKMGEALTISTLKEVVGDLPRNCAIRYVNRDSLSDIYLDNLDKALQDPYVYLVLSDTGSAASTWIGMITSKTYNHISISFDRDLKTLISYNGGEKLTPPGLNAEMIEWFFKKPDASIRVYRLKVTEQQKRDMTDKVKQINREGSAYNLIGMAVKHSFQPNIMVCSHFVYGLLCSVGAQYFVKSAADVRPTDLIELDYDRKLEYIETMHMSTFVKPATPYASTIGG